MKKLGLGKTTYYKYLKDVLTTLGTIPDSRHTSYSTTLDRLRTSYRDAMAIVTNPQTPTALRLRAIRLASRLAITILETSLKELGLYKQWLEHQQYFSKMIEV